MSDVVQIPRSEWENMKHQIAFLVKAIQPLAKGYKAPEWMTRAETMEELSIRETRLKQLRASGMIRYRKPSSGNCIEYLRKDIMAYKNGYITLPKKENSGNKKAPADTEAIH